MQKLIQGIHEFQNRDFAAMKGLFQELAKGQQPETLFVTCSDSRIDPGKLTRSQPGELFIIRNAGNLIPPHGASNGGEAATVEYAVAALGVKHIVVCGHSHCGAMSAVLHPEHVTKLPAVASWLKHAEPTRRIIREHYGDLDPDRQLMAAVEENVLLQLENLRTLPSVASRLVQGDLQLHGWVYKFETGEVFAFDPAVGQFVELAMYQLPLAEVAPRKRALRTV